MPFGESFLSTIKSNKSIMLDKSRRFRKTMGGYDWSKGQQFNGLKLTPQELKRIREKIQTENRKIIIKQVLVSVLIMLILVSICIYITQ